MVGLHPKYWALAPVLDIHNADILSHTLSQYSYIVNTKITRIETRAASALVFRVGAFGHLCGSISSIMRYYKGTTAILQWVLQVYSDVVRLSWRVAAAVLEANQRMSHKHGSFRALGTLEKARNRTISILKIRKRETSFFQAHISNNASSCFSGRQEAKCTGCRRSRIDCVSAYDVYCGTYVYIHIYNAWMLCMSSQMWFLCGLSRCIIACV